MESVVKNFDSAKDGMFFSHDNKIPDCFNIPVEQALSDERNFDYIFIVEEDIVLEEDTLERLIEAGADLTSADYNLGQGKRVHQIKAGYLLAGTGCTLFKRKVLEDLMPFRSDRLYNASDMEVWKELNEAELKQSYGHQDIDMFVRAQKAGYTVKIVGEVKHLWTEEYGQPGVNDGRHKIIERV